MTTPVSARRPIARVLRAVAFAAAAVVGCSAGDNTGIGGVLVVSQVAIDGGNRVVLIGGTRQLQATPRTSTGIAVPGKTVTWSSGNNARAQVSNAGVVTGVSAGAVSITATVDGVTGRIDLEVRPVPVASVEVTAAVTTLEAGETTLLEAVARDSVGGVLTGRTVAWTSLNPSVATVSADGMVTGLSGGTATITATIDGTSGSVPLTVTARTATRLGFVVQPSPAVAGQPIVPPIQVAFQDDGGATATTATGTITLSFSSNPTGATLSGSLNAQAVQGVATFTDVRVSRAGQPYSLQAATSGLPVVTSGTFAVTAGSAAVLSILSAPAGSAASGDPLIQQPVIQLRDALGNAVSQAGVTVTASVASGPGALSGSTAVVTDLDGRAVFTNLAIIGGVGTYTLRFQSPGLTAVTSGPIGLGAGDATQLTFTAAPPLVGVNGVALAGTIVVQLRDGTGNPVAQAGTLITASLSGGTGALSGTVAAATEPDGSAAFTGLVITGVVGEFVLTFASPGLTAAVSNPIALSPGPERALSFITPPGPSATNGQPLPIDPVVQLRDISGNAVPKAGVSIQVVAQSTSAGVVVGTLTRTTDTQGRAVFDDLALLGEVGVYRLAFRSGTLTEALSNAIQLAPGPATALGFATPPPFGATSGAPLVPQPVVQVVDQSGNAVAQSGVAITAALASGSGVLSGTVAAVTNAAGTATYTDLVLTGPAGPHTIRFSGGGFPHLVSATITVGAGSPTQLTFTTPPPATATNGGVISPAVVVQLRDGVGNVTPLAGITVTVTRTAGTASLGGTLSAQTGTDGSASFDDLILTGIVGNHELTFGAPGLTPAVSNLIALQAGAATQLTFTTAPPATATNGINITPAIQVQLRDLSGNAVASGGVNVTASIVTGAGGVLGGTTVVTTAGTGSATFNSLRITGSVGQYTLRFSAAGVSAATANPLTLQPGAATALAIQTQPPPSTTSGAVLAPQPIVRVVDQSGNTVTSSSLAVTASLASGPGTLGGTLTRSAASGIATFTNLAITGMTGSYTIAFNATGVTGVTSSTIGVGAGAPTGLQFVGTPPASGTNGVALAPATSVRLVDAAQNPVTQSGVLVTAVLNSGAGVLGGTVTTTTDGSGVASFANLILTGAAGNYTIRFEVSGITPVTTGTIGLAAGAATQLGFSTAPSPTATNGLALAIQPVVRLLDVSGNPVSQAGVTVVAAITTNPGGALTNASATTAPNGQATFSGLTITGLTGSYSLQYSSGALTPTSSAVSLSAGAPVAVEIFTQPGATAANGALLSPQPVARLVDQSGNNAGSNGTPVTVALLATPGPAVLQGTTTVNLGPPGARGVFTNLAISGTAGAYTLQFSSAGMTPVTSNTIAVGAGTATQLVFTTAPPTTSANGAVLTPAIGVRLGDATGNPVATAGVSITAAIATGSGIGLGGTTARVTDGTGAVSFSDLVLTGTAGDVTLTFTATGLTAATTGTLSVTAGAPAKLGFITAPPVAGTNGQVLAPATVVELRDQSNNPTGTTGTPVTAEVSAGAGGGLSGTLSVNTSAGSASFEDLVITGTAGNYTLRFTSPGLAPVSAASPLALAPAEASQLGFSVAPPGSATSGVAFSPQPQVQVRDLSGNAVAEPGLLVTAAVSAGGTLANATATTDAAGLAAFSGLALTGAAGGYTLTFSAPGFPDLPGGTVTLGAGSATQLAFVTSPPASATNGTPLSPQPVVELRDASNNPVPTANVSVSASLFSGSGSLLGTTSALTNGAGRATFTNLELRGLPDNYVVRFGAGALPALDSDPIALAIGLASQVAFQQAPPSSVTNGTSFPASTLLKLADVAGNTVATDGVSITASVASGPGAALSGTTTRTTTAGVATFDDLVLTGTAGSYTLDFTSGSLTKATSNAIQLTAGSATKLVFSTPPPTSAESGTAFTPAPVVQLQDASNNSVSQAGVTVMVSRVSGNAAVAIGGGSAITNAGGQATFGSLTLTGPADDYVLAFLSPGLIGVTSATISLTGGGAVKLGFATTPSTTGTNGLPLVQQPTVQLLDAADNPVAEAGRDITIGLQGGGALTATSLVVATDGNGQAVFDGVTITGTVGLRTLTFSGVGLSGLTSADIDLVAGPASDLAMLVQPPASAMSGATLSPAPGVQLVDESGNPVAQVGVDVTVDVTPAATLDGTLTVSTNASGVASFGDLSITGGSGNYTLDFAATGLGGVSADPVALSAASGLAISTQPSASVRNDQVFSPQPVIQLVDGSSNPVGISGITVTAEIESGGGTLLGTVDAVTNGAGLATFTDLRIQGIIGNRSLRFVSPGLSPVTSGTVTVTAGVASALAMETQPSATAVDAEPLPTAPVVKLVDVSGNDVDSTGVEIEVGVTPAGAALAGTTMVATGAGGSATFTGLSLGGNEGTYRLVFSALSLTGVESGDVTMLVPATLGISQEPPADAVSGISLVPQPSVEVRDGAASPLVGVSVTATLLLESGGPATLGGSVTLVTGAGGVATWTDLTITGSAGTYRLQFTTANGTLVAAAAPTVIP